MKKVFLLVGESSSGKDTLANLLVENDGYKQLISYATRPRRDGEGETHVFIDKSELESYRSDMVAYTKIGEIEYFATKQQLLESDVYTIDPFGIKYLKSVVNDINFIVIYINVSEEERRRRALEIRKDKPEVYEKRRLSEKEQFNEFKLNAEFDYSICNYDAEKSYKILKYIVKNEQ